MNEPYVQAEQWKTTLQDAGFDTVRAIMDQAEPFQLDNIVTARAVAADDLPTDSKAVTLLTKYPDPTQVTNPVKELISSLESEGYEVSLCSLSSFPIVPVDVISLLDIEEQSQTFFQHLGEKDLLGLVRIISQLHSRQILWLTGPAQISAKNPHSAMVLGFARTVRLELGSAFATMELDTDTAMDLSFQSPVVQVFAKLQKQGRGSFVDYEYALVNGVVQVPRFMTRTVDQMLPPTSQQEKLHTLCFGKPGLLSSLQWQVGSRNFEEPLDKDTIEVSVRAASVHHHDTQLQRNGGLGLECAGIVRRVSREANNSGFQVGDRVLCWTADSLASHVRIVAQYCVKIPDGLDFEEAVTLPTAYATAIRSLMEIHPLDAGDTILVHGAADSTGIAAVQIARMQQAEVFATAATEEEKRFLVEKQGVAECNIFSSEDMTSFVSGIKLGTKSRGVDVVINNLTGDLLRGSCECVAEGGTLFELAGKDAAAHGKLDMTMFAGNRGFYGLDIARLMTQKPGIARRYLETTMTLYEKGLVKPIHPIQRFGPNSIQEAFQQFQGTRRPIGAVCIEFPEDARIDCSMPSSHDDLRFRQDRSYLLIGGLGGLGRSASVWLAERGAGLIIFMSRSASADGDDERLLIQELNALGSQVQIVPGSVTDEAAVADLVAKAAKPIAGVMHLALVLQDEALLDMSLNSWQKATEAKVQGTWNLHNELREQPLDFFVLLSSIYGIQGNPKQANYAAASTFLDAFVQFRQQHGLPASVIDLGVMEDIGFVSQHTAILDNLRRAGAQCKNSRT
jgi:NADPH:quinone reductase-like Zn-dependent oxidoreductase